MQTFNLAGGAVQDIFAAMGDKAEAGLYRQAAQFAEQNVQFTKESTALKEFQQQRQAYKVIGEQKADVAGAGFSAGGTALDLLRESTQQAALAKETISLQGQIQEAGYEQQAKSYQMMASAADTAETGAFVSAGLKAAGAVLSLF